MSNNNNNKVLTNNNNNNNNYINPELITYISHVQQEQEIRNKKTSNIYYEKVFDKKYTGLNSVMNENINFDKVKKNQAKKGLLYLLNNLSKNNFCPEIETYFTELKKTKFNEIKNNYHQLIKKNKNLKNFRNNNNSINNTITTINNNNNEDDENEAFNSFSSREDQLKKNFEEEKLNILNKVMNNIINNQKESNVQWLKKKEKNNIELINNINNNKNYSNFKEYKNDYKGEDLENLYDIEELNEQKVFKFIPVKERLAKNNLYNNINYKNNNNNENKGNKGKNVYKNFFKNNSIISQNQSNINDNNDNSLSDVEKKNNDINKSNNTIKENDSILNFSNSEISEKKKKELNLKLEDISS